MTGAKQMMALENGLQFRIPRSNKINSVKIELNAMDTYDITFGYIHGLDYKERSQFNGIYCDDLQGLFTIQTGLDTSL